MTGTLAATALEVAAVALLALAVFSPPPTASYGVGAERLNESSYVEESVRSFSDVPARQRPGLRAAIETGHGTAPGRSAPDVEYTVRYEGEVYRTDAAWVSDAFSSFSRIRVAALAVALLAVRVGGSRLSRW